MTTSTSFAQMANNQSISLLSALRANTPPTKGQTTSRKFLTLSIFILLSFFTTNAWGADYSKNELWDFGKTGNTNWDGHKSDYCGACGSKSAAFNVYKTNITNFSNIDFSKYENVSLTIYVKAGTNSGTNSYTVKLIDANGDQVSTYTSTKSSGMGTGSNSSSAEESSVTFSPTVAFNGYKIEFPAKAYITQTRYVLTYDDKAAAHTVTWTINPTAGGTLSATSGNSTTVSPNAAYTYGASAYTVTSGAATVSQSGNTFTATPTANSTIQINMVEKPKYTVKFYKTSTTFESVTEASAGAGVTPPTMEEECGEWEFQGWSESSSNSETSTTPLSLVTLTNGKYYPTEDIDLYPVYTKSEGGGGTVTWNKITTAPTDWSGEYLIVNSDYAMTSDFYSGTSGEFKGAQVTISNNQVTSSPTDKMIWIVEKNGSNAQYSFKNKSTGTYAKITGTSSTNAALSSSVIWFTISSSSTSGVWKINSVDNSTRCFSYYSRNKTFRTYANSSNTTGSLYKKNGSSSTTYYYSYPQCVTETAVTLNPNEGTGSMADVTTQNGTLTLPKCTFTREGYTFAGWATTVSGEVEFADEAVVSNWDADITELFAKWTAKTITITWDANGGSVNPTSSTYTYNGATITLPTPTRTGYSFNGWFTTAIGGTKITEVGTTNKPTEDVTYYAQWISNKTATSLSWSPTSYSATIDADNTFPELTKLPADLTGVTYSSSNTSVATIDENTGDITLVAAGTTTITATFTETATHTGATASYTLTVNPSNCKWVETTTIDDGDEVVITTKMEDVVYALPNNYGTSTPNVVLVDNIKNNEIPSVSNDIKWTIEKQGGQYIFHPNGDLNSWLYCTNSNDGVRVGTNANNTFAIGQNLESITHVVTSRSIRIGSTDLGGLVWRCYTTTSDQTLKFYKRECLDASKVWVEGNLANVTCDQTLPQQLAKNGSLTLNFEAATGYALPDNVTVTGTTPSWNKATGTLTISNPTANVTITIEAVKLHTINWMVGSSSVLTEEVANGTGVTKTPTNNPEVGAIGSCANKFMGWSEESAGSTPQDAAYYDDLCSAAQMKSKHSNVTGDKTFYAVFATATTTPGTSTTTNKTYTHTITSKTWDANGAKTLSNISWTLSNNGDYYGYDGTKGQQVGSGSKPAKSMTLTTSGFASASKITSVTINTSGASDTNAKVSVKVGGTSYSCNANTTPAISTTATDYKFTGNSTGEIVISWSQTSSKAIYFKSITVEYSNTTTTPDVTTYSNYITNCCALAPATNLTVSGTTSNTATLIWIAPSPTTGITKLQVRNAETDEVVVNDIDVNTTTATITEELTECTSYQYYVVSVGDCEVFSNTVTATPFSGAKTVNYDYNGGSGSVASFTTSCTNQTITLPAATRAGYDFNGWYTAATGGTKVGDAGGTYDPTISSITLYAQWTKKIYIISFHASGGEGTMANQSADENDVVAQLNANQFTRDGYAFVGWNTKANGAGIAYADQATDITLTGNLTLYAQWAAIVTLNDAGNITTTHPAIADGSITIEDGANACDPYEFVGWTAIATGDWNEGINEPALVATTYTPNAPTTLYAVYKIQSEGNANAFKLSFEGGNGKTYYVGSYNSSPYLRGYSNITKEEAVTFIRTKMYPDNDTKYYIYMEQKSEYLYYNGTFNSTSSTPDENQGWVFHTVGDKIKLQSTYSYDPEYLSFTDRDDETINMKTNDTGSEFNMLPAVTSTYVAAPLCNQKITITFETGNGDFVDNAPKPNPLTVNRGDVITLPTCEYPGYEFMGWLKDEQQLDPSDIIGTYYTGDYTVDGVSSTITFYAYYKVIPEEVEFTGKDDVELLMYYYDGTENYYYSVSHGAERGELSSKQNCFNATTWTFTNVGNMQYHIQDETGKYLGAYSDGDNDLILSATPKVWIFTEVNGLWKMICENSPSRALMYISTGKKFANAAISNEGNAAYSYVTLGICPYPTYTTNPVLSQGFSITNTAMVTSASGQKVKAASALTLETRNIELPCTFTISAPNITFYDTNGNEVTELTSSTASEQFELYFAYKPTAENTIEYPTITIVDDEMKTYTIKNRIYARSLPATFAIVAKVGNLWYALPSQGLNSTTPPAAYPIEVDDMADPTAVTAVPENADWSLRGVYEASRSDATKDRYVANGDNLVFANNASPAMTLNASSSEKENYLLTDAQYNNYYSTNPGLYEWTPTTTDLETYQLTNEQRSRTLSVNTATVFGVHAQDKAVEQVRFLPITGRYTPAALQVVEWKENSVVIIYNGDPAQPAFVSVNGAAAQETVLSSAQRDIAVYELTATGLAVNPTQRLSITIGADKVILPIPYIISGAQTDLELLPGSTVAARQEVAKVADLVVLKDAKLTAAGAKSGPYKFRNATIYGGGKLVIPSDKGFGVASLTLRAGGITDDGKYDYVYPQFELRGTFTNSAAKINYDYITDYDHWFHLVLPFSGDLGTIKYPTEFYGANVAANNTGSWQIKRYAGEIRATGNYDAWKDIETEGKTSTIAGQGYIFWGAPKKVTVNGKTTRQKWGIQRITMSITAPNAMTAENGDKAISELSSYANVPNNSRKDNDQGWNLIGNPYMVNLTDMATTGLHACKLVEVIDPATGKWNGKWEWNDETNIRYLTIPSDHFDTYTAKTVAQSVPLIAGRAFFVQLDGEANGITFAAAKRASLMPALLAENNDKPVDIETGIVLSNETSQDEVNFWIKDGKTNDYEYNADYPKTPNNNRFNIYGVHTNGDLSWVATSPEYAAQSMPIGYQVPAAGTFTLSVSETYYSENLQALFVTDHEASPEVTTNLVDEDYTFYVNQAETNNTRFTVSIILKPDKENTPTGVDNINTKANQPIKFLYQDKIYILRNGMIYDTTGKQVITINK
ncbi:MAG: InlB B-repeat-containing protein [Paludibacteraceae bacterium]|nr:InlB B-repeat-containing protein [Paludibacteraceae bacterium]